MPEIWSSGIRLSSWCNLGNES